MGGEDQIFPIKREGLFKKGVLKKGDITYFI